MGLGVIVPQRLDRRLKPRSCHRQCGEEQASVPQRLDRRLKPRSCHRQCGEEQASVPQRLDRRLKPQQRKAQSLPAQTPSWHNESARAKFCYRSRDFNRQTQVRQRVNGVWKSPICTRIARTLAPAHATRVQVSHGFGRRVGRGRASWRGGDGRWFGRGGEMLCQIRGDGHAIGSGEAGEADGGASPDAQAGGAVGLEAKLP
jgi:hypothetical protein